MQAATVIAKHTGTLCNACKLASSRTSNPVAKKEFVQFAKQVAGATAELVKNIKVQTVHVLITIFGNATLYMYMYVFTQCNTPNVSTYL